MNIWETIKKDSMKQAGNTITPITKHQKKFILEHQDVFKELKTESSTNTKAVESLTKKQAERLISLVFKKREREESPLFYATEAQCKMLTACLGKRPGWFIKAVLDQDTYINYKLMGCELWAKTVTRQSASLFITKALSLSKTVYV